MNGPAVDLVVDRLVLEGLDLDPDQGTALAGMVQDELRRLADAGALSDDRPVALTEVLPAALTYPPDLPAMARALARRIAAEVANAGGRHV